MLLCDGSLVETYATGIWEIGWATSARYHTSPSVCLSVRLFRRCTWCIATHAPVSRRGAAPAHSSPLSPVLASAATLLTRYWRDGPPDAAYLLSWKPREMQQTACTTNNGILPARSVRLFTGYFHADKFTVLFSCVWANSQHYCLFSVSWRFYQHVMWAFHHFGRLHTRRSLLVKNLWNSSG